MQTYRKLFTLLVPALVLVAGLALALREAAAAGDALPAPAAPAAPGPAVLTGTALLQQRADWFFDQRTYPLGYIPDGAHANAMRQIAQAQASRSPAAPRAGAWTNIGPGPFMGVDWVRPMAGRIDAIAIDPANPAHWLIGAATGGIWESRDSGATWTPRSDDQPSLAMGAIAFAPSAPNVVYAGTGDAMRNGGGYAGAGLLKSTDGGATWQIMAGDTFSKTAFKRIVVNPTISSTLLAATVDGEAGRGHDSIPLPPPTGIYKSTDGGVSWRLVLTGTATALVAAAGNFNDLYAALGDGGGSPANGVYRSSDAGDNWALESGIWTQALVGRVELAGAPSQAGTVYVSIGHVQNAQGNSNLLGLWRTDNAWAITPSWTSVPVTQTDDGSGQYGFCAWDVTQGGSNNGQCWYNHALSVDPANPDTLYAAGTPLWKCTSCGASPTWLEVSQTTSKTNGIHVDQHTLAWAGSQLLVGNDGGLFGTTDGGATWTSHNNHATLLFYEGSIHPTNPDFAIGGFQDNSSQKRTGNSSTWQELGGGDGADNAIATANPDTNWAISDQQLFIKRTVDAGVTIDVVTGTIDTSKAPFIARFEKCPSNDDVFIAGTNRVWRTSDFFGSAPAQPNWAANSPAWASISALAFAPSDTTCNTYAIGTRTGGISLTVDGGATWTSLDPGDQVPNRYVTGLAFNPASADVLYVTLSGFDEGTPGKPGHLFRTASARAATPAWVNVSPPVNIPHDSVSVGALPTETVYVGTDIGVWLTTNAGGAWTHFGPETGMPNVPVFEIKLNPATNRVYAFTFGRSAFVANLGPVRHAVFMPLITSQ